MTTTATAPIPVLRIVPVHNVHPHEEHDPQRARPLIERIRQADLFTNPPIVAPIPMQQASDANGYASHDEQARYVVLDGANRYYCMRHLGYEHLLVQIAPYNSDIVQLGVWHHIISHWDERAFEMALAALPDIELKPGWQNETGARILFRSGGVYSIDAPSHTFETRNALLRQLVRLYQQHAVMFRTALTDPSEIWPLYPEANALVFFPHYQPQDIIYAAQEQAYLPPGVSRHVIQGRALMLNYPLAVLGDPYTSLEAKNSALQVWLRRRLSERAVRYYAESTYQFDE